MTDAAEQTPSATAGRLWLALAAGSLAVAFQFQATLVFYDTFIRIVVADLIAPVVLAVAAVAFLRGRIGVPRSRLPYLWLWLALLTAWMTVSLVTGRVHTGGWQTWALVNKYLGWFALLGFFLLGMLVATAHGGRHRRLFLTAFLAAGWAVAAYGVTAYVLARFGLMTIDVTEPCDIRNLYFSPEDRAKYPDFWLFVAAAGTECTGRLQGFMANPNAYGYFLAILLALQLPLMSRGELFARPVHIVGLACLLAALVFTGSRTAWLASTVCLAVLLVAGELRWRQVAPAMLIAAVIVSAVFVEAIAPGGQPVAGGPASDPLTYFAGKQIRITTAESVIHRLGQARRSLDFWLSAPIRGVGLGSFLWQQVEAQNPTPSTIHNTGLWLLAEFGLIGFVLYVTFFVFCLKALWPGRRQERSAVGTGVFTVLCVFATASITMEAMYQRHLWFLLGFALALPREIPPAHLPAAGAAGYGDKS